MGNNQALPEGQNSNNEMEELAAIIASPKFKEDQVAFFEKYAKEFSNEEENKLSYTSIHQEYETQVEGYLMYTLGQEKLQRIQLGMPAFIEQGKENKSLSLEVYDAIEVLSSLGDFENFKASMIAKKNEMEGKEGNHEIKELGVVDIGEVMENMKQLRAAGEDMEGWNKLVDNPEEACWTKLQENGDTILRCTFSVDCHPALLLESFVNNTPASCEFWPEINSKTVQKDWGPNDFVVTYDMNLPWAVRYIMGFPNILTLHVVSQKDFPSEGCYGYSCVPYDMATNKNTEKQGPYSAESGIIAPDPQDPNKCELVSLMTMNMGQKWLPTAAFKKLVQAEVIAKYRVMFNAYMKSALYAETKAKLGL